MFIPFFIYVISWTYVLMLYYLNWSNLQPDLSASVLIFLVLSVIIMLFLGFWVKSTAPIKWKSVKYNKSVEKITMILLVVHGFNYIYARKIPLLEILLNKGFVYTKDFHGIPFLQTFLLSGTIFLITYLWHMFISEKKKRTFFLIVLNLIPIILTSYRILVVIIILNCFWISMFKVKKINYKTVISVLVIFLVSGYLFGKAGDIRTASQFGLNVDNSDAILLMGGATDEFRSSAIPKPYFWVYLYSTSSLANFQSIVSAFNVENLSVSNVTKFINNELLYSVISERINSLTNYKVNNSLAMNSPAFTVATVYGKSFTYLGWLGPIVIFDFSAFICVVYYFFMKKRKEWFLIGISILNTIIFLNIFSNMFVWTTLSIQLLFPIIFSFIKIKRIKI